MGDCVLKEKERLLEKKEGMQSGLNLREDRFRVPSGSSGRDHHLPSLSLPPSLSFFRAVILNDPVFTMVPPDDDTH